jgi:hypothetical protein
MILNFAVVSLAIEFLLALTCLTCLIQGVYKKSLTKEIPYQTVYLLMGLLTAVVRVGLLVVYESSFLHYTSLGTPELCPYLNPNWRIATILLSFYEIAYTVLYFSRFRYLKAIKVSDKLGTICIQALLYLIPIMFIIFLYIGNSNTGNYDLTPYLNGGSIIYLTHRLPEAKYVNTFMSNVYFIYIIISLITIKNILNKSKLVIVSYSIFIFSIVIKILLSKFIFMPSLMLDIIDRILLNFTLDAFFIIMIFTGRHVLNEYDFDSTIK